MARKKKKSLPVEDLNTYIRSLPKVKLLEKHETIALGRLLRGTISDHVIVSGEDIDTYRTDEEIQKDWEYVENLGCFNPEQAKDHLMLANTRLVVAEAVKYFKKAPPNVTVMDLISEGLFGLFDAARRFNPEVPCKFSTYATWWVRRYILKALTGARVVRIPYYMHGLLSRLPWAECKLKGSLGREPTLPEIAEFMNCKEQDITRTNKVTNNTKVFSVQRRGEGSDPLSGKEDNSCPLSRIDEFDSDCKMVWATLEKMPHKYAYVVMLRYGFLYENSDLVDFPVKKVYTFDDLGKIFEISREKARLLEKDSVDSFRFHYLDVVREMKE